MRRPICRGQEGDLDPTSRDKILLVSPRLSLLVGKKEAAVAMDGPCFFLSDIVCACECPLS